MTSALLTVPEVAKLLNVSVPRCYELTRTGKIPVVKLGRQTRIDPERLKQFLDAGGASLTNNHNCGSMRSVVANERQPK